MAEAAVAAEAAPLHRGLPDEIVVWEILVRLPPKPLLRCRAVCPAWRRATSTRDFLLAHHARQPSLPLLCGYEFLSAYSISLDVIPFDHRAGLAASSPSRDSANLTSVSGPPATGSSYSAAGTGTWATPSATQQLASMLTWMISTASPSWGCTLTALPVSTGCCSESRVMHLPTKMDTTSSYWAPTAEAHTVPRCRGHGMRILFRGSLHWHAEQHGTASNMIKVFSTTTESFRQMRAPAVPGKANLFEMDGMLGMSSFNDAVTAIDIWMTQDYESEAWAIKYRVELLATAELTVMFGLGMFDGRWSVAPSLDGDVLVLVEFGDWLLQIDMDSKVVASFQRALRCTDQLRLKQSLVPHSFFPTLEGYVVNDSPFM
ncbi:hypothetical protein ACQ4PT_055244 [Festuca glaucescens]